MKPNRAVILLGVFLISSLGLNAYFFYLNNEWEAAFYHEVGTIAEIEIILKNIGADTSYDNILSISKTAFKSMAKEVQADSIYVQAGADEKAIKIIDAEIIFKNGKYYGTKVYLPK